MSNEQHPIEEYLPALRPYALRLTRSAVDADDLLQDVAERALRLWPAYEGGVREVGAWLRLVVWQEFCRRYRRDQRARAIEGTDEPRAGDMRRDVAPLEAKQQIAELLGPLSPERREVVERHHVEGQPVAEIAAAMGTPVGTVCTRLHRALKELRGEFDSTRGRAGVDTARRQPAKRVQADADRVDGVVRARHERTLVVG